MTEKRHQGPATGDRGGAGDSLFEPAVEYVIANGGASCMFLQRRLAIGYASASQLIDRMQREGVLGDYTTGRAHIPVLMTMDEWRAKRGLAPDPPPVAGG